MTNDALTKNIGMPAIEEVIAASMLVPMTDPHDAECIWGLPLMLWGDPGIGKSDRITSASLMAALPCRVVYAATLQPEDLSGVPLPSYGRFDEEHIEIPSDFLGLAKAAIGLFSKFLKRMGKGGVTIESTVPAIRQLFEDQQGVLFMDELSCARPAIQSSWLGVVLTRMIAGKRMPPGVRIIGAGNPPETAAGGWDLEPPMANRFCHIEVKKPTKQEWGAWLTSILHRNIVPIEDGEAKIKANWTAEFAKVCHLQKSFIEKNDAEMLHEIPPEGHKSRGRAWPSPRTWDFAGRALAACWCLDLEEAVATALMEGCVGEGAATAFAAFVEENDLPDPLDMLNNGWTPDKKRIDRTHIAYGSMVSFVRDQTERQKSLELAPLAWKRLHDAVEANLLDVATPHAHSLVKAGLDSKASPAIKEAAYPVLVRLAKSGAGDFVSNKS